MKKLPIGNQHLKQFVEGGLVYVDKTPLIYKLLTEGSYYFLSRPRRFGKSLLVDTLKQILLGNQDLFKDLWIYDKMEWKQHPVIHLDFSIIAYKAKGLDRALVDELQRIGNEYGVSVDSDNCKDALRDLIEGLAKIGKVAVLIDEYDKPITDCVTNPSKALQNENLILELFHVLKYTGNLLQFLFIEGSFKLISKSVFSVSIISDLEDLTYKEEYAPLIGNIGDYETFLEERMRMMNNSESNSSWGDVKSRLYEKYE